MEIYYDKRDMFERVIMSWKVSLKKRISKEKKNEEKRRQDGSMSLKENRYSRLASRFKFNFLSHINIARH
jgi:hypothetical protein